MAAIELECTADSALEYPAGFVGICMLLVLGIWRHVVKRFPLRYDPLYWGAVFPLGMYTVATRQMAAALDLPFLDPLPPVVFVAALAAWSLAFAGLLWQLASGLFLRRRNGAGGE